MHFKQRQVQRGQGRTQHGFKLDHRHGNGRHRDTVQMRAFLRFGFRLGLVFVIAAAVRLRGELVVPGRVSKLAKIYSVNQTSNIHPWRDGQVRNGKNVQPFQHELTA